jgi:putative ABC transport system ATP-binding protein
MTPQTPTLKPPPSPTQGITIEGLSQEFSLPDGSRLRVLDDVSFELPPRRATAIVGASGSGKSTLLSLMAGLEQPTSGRITVLGQCLQGLSEEELSSFRAKHLGFVFQSFQLINHFDALTNVALAAQICGLDHPRDRALQELERVGLKGRWNHTPLRLSGGECQRVALARALVKRPEILLCDEPTGNLDPNTAAQIFELLLQTRETHNTTVVLVTHDRDLAARCDGQITMSRGRLDPQHAGRAT